MTDQKLTNKTDPNLTRPTSYPSPINNFNDEDESEDKTLTELNSHGYRENTKSDKSMLNDQLLTFTDVSKLKSSIEIKFANNNDETCVATISSPAGKATGKNNFCYNIEYKFSLNLAGTRTWIDPKTLNNLKVIESVSEYTDEIFENHYVNFDNAKIKRDSILGRSKGFQSRPQQQR